MADIYIAYAREDLKRVQPLVEVFRGHGWKVWWDQDIKPGQDWNQQVRTELKRARSIVVVWSEISVDRSWVNNEARFGLRRKSLFPARIDQSELPPEFDHIQTVDLSDWMGERKHDGVARLMDAVAELLGKRGSVSKTDYLPQTEDPSDASWADHWEVPDRPKEAYFVVDEEAYAEVDDVLPIPIWVRQVRPVLIGAKTVALRNGMLKTYQAKRPMYYTRRR